MGGIYSRFMRPVRTFNVANRAEKIISREKPIPAPQYASIEKQKKLMDEVHPEFMEKQYQKNMQLDQRLKDVFIKSTDLEEITSQTKSKLLPQDRYNRADFNIDFYEPASIPKGKCTLRQAFTFISQHKNDPIKYNSENIAAKYEIDKRIIDDILKHFKIYMSIVPNVSDEVLPDPLQEMMNSSYASYKEIKSGTGGKEIKKK